MTQGGRSKVHINAGISQPSFDVFFARCFNIISTLWNLDVIEGGSRGTFVARAEAASRRYCYQIILGVRPFYRFTFLPFCLHHSREASFMRLWGRGSYLKCLYPPQTHSSPQPQIERQQHRYISLTLARQRMDFLARSQRAVVLSAEGFTPASHTCPPPPLA